MFAPGWEPKESKESMREVIERAAYAAIGHVDCRPKNAPEASRVIADFVMGELKDAFPGMFAKSD